MIKEIKFTAKTIKSYQAEAKAGNIKLGSEAIIQGHENLALGSYTGRLTAIGRERTYREELNLPKILQTEVILDGSGDKVWVKVTESLLTEIKAGLRVRFSVIEREIDGTPQRWAQFELGGIGVGKGKKKKNKQVAEQAA